MAQTIQIPLDVKCPFCFSDPGEPCYTSTGKRVTARYHARRRRVYSAERHRSEAGNYSMPPDDSPCTTADYVR